MTTTRLTAFVCAALAAVAGVGCSESKGNRVTGKVTFKGQPVAAGKIYFTPATKTTDGTLPGFADIKDGTYDTSRKGSQGVMGGEMAVKIEGMDSSGKLIFIHNTTCKLGDGAATQDFDVPETAANNVPKNTGPEP